MRVTSPLHTFRGPKHSLRVAREGTATHRTTKDGERSSGGLALIIGARSLADLSRDSVA